jgi:phenylacetate-CoA ligase
MTIEFIKKNLTNMPLFLGEQLSKIPYSYRPLIGKIYRERSRDIGFTDSINIDQKKNYIFERVKKIAEYASKDIPFYTDLYRRFDVQPGRFSAYKDLKNLPIIRKDDLQKVDIEYRSSSKVSRYLVNTGGSSGKPLSFYIQQTSVAHEWAHIHKAWSQVGFKQNKLKLVFAGRSNINGAIVYDSVRHQINANIYLSKEELADTLCKLYKETPPEYLHGYPSAIFDFILYLRDSDHPLMNLIKNNTKGILLGSEMPSPIVREEVEKLLKCKSISWYGHTERAILAAEKKAHGDYYPYLTYGFAEAELINGGFELCGTSYYNYASPLIRYSTGDGVDPLFNDGILESFRITTGREGEYIFDKNNNKIYLTGLIFGRHHDLLNYSNYIQVYQETHGKALIKVVPNKNLKFEICSSLFDSRGVQIDFSFEIISEPHRTLSGKVPLLIKSAKFLESL